MPASTRIKYALAFGLAFTVGNSAFGIEDYQVKEGDSLWKLSRHFFNDPFYWRCIWRYNTWIENPAIIQPGQKIDIPHALDCATELPISITEKEALPNQASHTSAAPINTKLNAPIPTSIKQNSTGYLVSPGVEEVIIYTRDGYEAVPAKLLVDQQKRNSKATSKVLPNNVVIDEKLVRSLFPADPRLKKE